MCSDILMLAPATRIVKELCAKTVSDGAGQRRFVPSPDVHMLVLAVGGRGIPSSVLQKLAWISLSGRFCCVCCLFVCLSVAISASDGGAGFIPEIFIVSQAAMYGGTACSFVHNTVRYERGLQLGFLETVCDEQYCRQLPH